MSALVVENLVKEYDGVRVVDGISFSVAQGEIYGFLGPNGAGKTTSLEIIEGLRDATDGQITVVGLDSRTHRKEINARIGVQLQATLLEDRLTVYESVDLYGSYYGCNPDVDAILADVQLDERRNVQQKKLSGGQKQRLALALALVNDPDVLFLDEPTTGLDPQSRHNLWDVVLRLKKRGKTVILTTHYMDEAEYLCDRIAILDHGKIIAEGTPGELTDLLGASHVISVPVLEGQGGIDGRLESPINTTLPFQNRHRDHMTGSQQIGQFAGRPFSNDFAMIKNRNAVTQILRFVHVMSRQNHRLPTLLQSQHHIPQVMT